MSNFATVNGWPVLSGENLGTEIPSWSVDLASELDAKTIHDVPDLGARDAKFPGLGVTDRAWVFVENDGSLQRWTGSAWQVVTKTGAADWTNFPKAALWAINTSECNRMSYGNGQLHTARYKLWDPKTITYNFRFLRGTSTGQSAGKYMGVSCPFPLRHGFQPGAATLLRKGAYQTANTQGWRMSGESGYDHYVICFPTETFSSFAPSDGWEGGDIIAFTLTAELA